MPPASTNSSFKFTVAVREHLADTVTPVAIYLRVRDRFPYSLLLESADSRGSEGSFSFICFDEIASFSVDQGRIVERLPNGEQSECRAENREEVLNRLDGFRRRFTVSGNSPYPAGIFGYVTFDAIEHFEDITLANTYDSRTKIPEIRYGFYRYVAVINHFNQQLSLLEYAPDGFNSTTERDSAQVFESITRGTLPSYPFLRAGSESSNFTDAELKEVIRRCKGHIARGDIFQIVPSRRFEQGFSGDEFMVYRALRSINPSPYLFFFDYGDYRIFGSSPESQLTIKNGKATLFPIAGTYRRSGDEKTDLALAEKLLADEKENAEHVMLVDLARNDLSKHCSGVHVESFKEAHFYSHVIHLVSKVSGTLRDKTNPIHVLADTYPAGTLSGAPKYRAIQLIDQFERGRRGFYAGALGFFGLDGSCNHAIVIRSFLSRDRTLFFQAGAGIVFDSVEQSEVDEVQNKLGALRRAIELAEQLS